jgi:hypothetical protein
MRTTLKKYATTVITSAVMSIFIFGCDKEEEFINPFSDIQTLDCRNLIIQNVILTGNIVEVTLENTCKTCEDGWLYLGMVMINRVSLDTLAQTECLTCYSCPKNGESEKYELTTNLTALPDLKSMQFNFGYLCTDLTYLKR